LITLALDTATPAPSLAILRDGAVVAERSLDPAQAAGRRVAEEVHRLLGDAGMIVGALGEIVVGVGPGGFTGLRIGIATALGLGQALAIPVRGVASIEALALGIVPHVPERAIVVPVIDAKRHEVFTAAYRGVGAGKLETLIEPIATTETGLAERLADLASPGAPVYLAGDGCHRVAELASQAVRVLPEDSAAHRMAAVRLAERAAAGGGRPVTPLYLRLPDAEVNRIRREREAATA
jgi:tRNA threonylcarbamoyladenosine biosynthesis protein TsaB